MNKGRTLPHPALHWAQRLQMIHMARLRERLPGCLIFPARSGLIIAALLTGCTTMSVRAPVCEPPPLPPELTKPCPPAIMPTGPSIAEFYENTIANVTGPWRECARMHDQTIAVVQYRDSICAKIKADNAQPRAWYEFWK